MIDFSKMRFLVVDDFSEFRSSIRGILGLLAVQKIDTAANGEEVLELCRRNRYDVILHDYNLGEGVSGQQVLERLHAERLLSPHCIFIMVTAENTQAMVLAAIECEPDDYLSKPFSKVALQTRLERMIRRKQVLAPVLTALENGDCHQVLQACDEIEARDQRHAVLCKKYKATALYNLGEFARLEQLLEQQARTRPAGWNLQMLARLWLEQGRQERLNPLLDAAMRQFPLMPELHDIRALQAMRSDDLPATVQSLQKAVGMSPNTVRRQIALIAHAWLNRQPEIAVYAVRQVWEIGKYSVAFDPELLWQLASMLLEGGTNRSTEEARSWLKALERPAMQSPRLQPLTDLLQLLFQHTSGQTPDAAHLNNTVERLQSQLKGYSAVTLLQVADWLVKLDQPAAAQACWQLCAERYSAMAGVPAYLAERWSAYPREQLVAAIEQGRNARAQHLTGQLEEAGSSYAEALEAAPAMLETNMMAARFYSVQSAAGDNGAHAALQSCLQRIEQMSPLEPEALEFSRLNNPLGGSTW